MRKAKETEGKIDVVVVEEEEEEEQEEEEEKNEAVERSNIVNKNRTI